MKACMLYRKDSELSRMVEEYVTDFSRARNVEIELLDLNSREAADMAELYGIIEYPALLVIREDGQLVQHWQGQNLPLANELAGYLNS